jgi:hypothetical protein
VTEFREYNSIPRSRHKGFKPSLTDRELGSADDFAKRAFDIMNLHVIGKGDQVWGKWVAFRLSDGGSDNVLYDTREQAIDHQLHPLQSCYLVIPPTGFTLEEIREFLTLSRAMYNKGARIPSHGDYRARGFKV